uniref:Nitric oxide-associated protein 1 n=1 Tax=Hirondellea gigas TaxID=1518452 RepID=A0A2P2I2E8_9CRUS
MMLRNSFQNICLCTKLSLKSWYCVGRSKRTHNNLLCRTVSSSSSHTKSQQQKHELQVIHEDRYAVQLRKEDLTDEVLNRLPPVVRFIVDRRIIYSSYIEDQKPRVPHRHKKRLFNAYLNVDKKLARQRSMPCFLEKILGSEEKKFIINNEDHTELELYKMDETIEKRFPYALYSEVEKEIMEEEKAISLALDEPEIDYTNLKEVSVEEDTINRIEQYDKGELKPFNIHIEQPKKEAFALSGSQYVDQGDEELDPQKAYDEDQRQFGTADPNVPVSNVPCGGCGALLHCQNPSLPGFKAKEVFLGVSKAALRSTVCQRCHFLTHHNMALQVRVSPESYLELLRPIKTRFALVLVLVDLTDAPCSVHPNIMDVIARGQPVILVGNKVDLLPMDSNDCLERLEAALKAVVMETSLVSANILDTCLVSGQTGFGIETLISSIHYNWQSKGDVYLVGSTNAGKSTLFNTLMRSDLCKVKAADMLLRATTSPWPGTTLNMLKFPMTRASGRRLMMRKDRLSEDELNLLQDVKSINTYTRNKQLATLTGNIGRSPTTDLPAKVGDLPSPTNNKAVDIFQQKTKPQKFSAVVRGINQYKDEFKAGKWVYDTPGALQPDQFLSLLTHEELQEVLPTSMLVPESFRLKAGQTLFIAGLVRLDILYLFDTELEDPSESSQFRDVKVTVFRSEKLPISVVSTLNASSFYADNLGTELLNVPFGSHQRMEHWPQLRPTTLRAQGAEGGIAGADVVLSSAGWVSLCMSPDVICDMRAWTPGGRGAYLREHPFLPHSVTGRGKLWNSVKYGSHTLFRAEHFKVYESTMQMKKQRIRYKLDKREWEDLLAHEKE